MTGSRDDEMNRLFGVPRSSYDSFECGYCHKEFPVGMNATDEEIAAAIKTHALIAHGEDVSVRPKGSKKWL